MPERRNVVTHFTELIFGGPWQWNGLIGEISERETERSGFTTADYDAARQVVDDLYMELLGCVDWNRVILDAQGIHERRRHLHEDPPWSLSEEICPQCLRDALAIPTHGDRGDPEGVYSRAQRIERTSRLRSWARKAMVWKALGEIAATEVHDKRCLAAAIATEEA